MTKHNRIYLPLAFFKVKIQHKNKMQTHSLCIGLELLCVKNFDVEKRLRIPNRIVGELQLNQHIVFDIHNIKHPIFIPHPCMLRQSQIFHCFGHVRNYKNGLCSIVNDDVIHNCKRNRLFFIDPFISRLIHLLYQKIDQLCD